jgi:hypothetical protein
LLANTGVPESAMSTAANTARMAVVMVHYLRLVA